MPAIPSGGAVAKGLVITLISLTIINFTKGYLPQSVRNIVGV